MGNDIYLAPWNRIDIAQKLRRLFTHYHQTIREACNFFHYNSLFRIWIAQNRVERCDHRHLQLA